ncbi:MAG: glycosyltransferase family 2 protein [Vicinamibacterales bacterium]
MTTAANHLDAPRISVIIPTRNRLDALKRCLAALDAQTLPRDEWEVIVVNDGSTDGTDEYLTSGAAAGIWRYTALSQGGPARARNAGIREARGRVLVFIGDDIYATPAFLERHLALHDSRDGDATAVLGRTEWAHTLHVTPLMRYEGLGQFDYHEIEAGAVDASDLPFRFFYTSNVSVCRSFLERHGLLFDEDFRQAMGEDGEFAFRARRHGLRLRYEPDALAHHDHPTTFTAARKRCRLKGEVTILQAHKHPEWANLEFLALGWRGRIRHGLRRLWARALVPVLTWADLQELEIDAWRLGWAFDFVFAEAEFAGMRDAWGTKKL